MRESRTDRIFNAVIIAFILLIMLIMVYPLYYVVIASFSDPSAVATGRVTIIPVDITFEAYSNVLKNDSVWTGYINSIIYTVLGTMYNLIITIPAAYVLSKKHLFGRSVISWYFFITMYFSGGMIPSYLLMKSLKLLNTRWVLIINAGVSCYNLIVSRQFFESNIPDSLFESATIDGANDFISFFRIALPLSKPILAVMVLYYAVDHWNAYYSAMIYINDTKLFPLQLVLRRLLLLDEMAQTTIEMNSMTAEEIAYQERRAYMAYAMKYALIFISSAPLLIAYPFVQKYFVKGVMIGSVKG